MDYGVFAMDHGLPRYRSFPFLRKMGWLLSFLSKEIPQSIKDCPAAPTDRDETQGTSQSLLEPATLLAQFPTPTPQNYPILEENAQREPHSNLIHQ
ncbi:hypothetical protein CHS0354_016119 [Potamilus streckersoni]|uniref:Uncharacterized protein n=1 Tax=Potamilus streckersoni TaxID=2493646 RepID=A0AAE0W675_9BIVA|nr:hypothetical protein CHS0354_016119 [Potamilus streckersoni]